MEKLIQLQTEQVLLTYLLHWSVDEQCNTTALASGVATVKKLKTWVEAQQKTSTDPQLSAHYALVLQSMAAPDKSQPTLHTDMPPGAPIGCDVE